MNTVDRVNSIMDLDQSTDHAQQHDTDKMSHATKRQSASHLQVDYHPAFEGDFDIFANCAGLRSEQLRQLIDTAIRMPRTGAQIERQSDPRTEGELEVYHVVLDAVTVYFSCSDNAVLVRGIRWEIDRDPEDDFDGGGYFL